MPNTGIIKTIFGIRCDPATLGFRNLEKDAWKLTLNSPSRISSKYYLSCSSWRCRYNSNNNNKSKVGRYSHCNLDRRLEIGYYLRTYSHVLNWFMGMLPNLKFLLTKLAIPFCIMLLTVTVLLVLIYLWFQAWPLAQQHPRILGTCYKCKFLNPSPDLLS